MSENQSSDALKQLVTFMVLLAILGTIFAVAGYLLWPVPPVNAVPSNAMVGAAMEII